MKIGKVSQTVLNRSVLRPLHMAAAAGSSAVFGRDSAVFAVGNTGEEVCAQAVWAGVSAALGGTFDRTLEMVFSSVLLNLAAEGARGERIMMDLLLPVHMDEEELKCLMGQAGELGARFKVTVEGGHTEVSDAVLRPVVTVTGLGFLPGEGTSPGSAVREAQMEMGKAGAGAGAKSRPSAQVGQESGLRPGMELVMAGFAGAAGTAILAENMEAKLLERYPFTLVDRAKRIMDFELLLEAARARNHFGVSAMHDVSQGGVFGALWEMAEHAGAGLEVDLKKIPIRQETIEICEYFDLNPYQMYGQGALLFVTSQGERLVSYLKECSMEAAVIGRVTEKNQRIIRNGEEMRYLDRPAQDELWRLAQEWETERQAEIRRTL